MEECFNFLQSNSDLNVTYAGREHCVPLHKSSGIRNHFIVHYVVAGEGILKLNGRTHRLTPGDAFFLFPEQKNFYQASKTDPWTYKWIGFAGSRVEEILASIYITRESPVYRGEYSKGIDGRFDELFANLKTAPKGYELKALGLFYLILFDLFETSKHLFGKRDSKREDYVSAILKFIDANYQRNVSVYQMAEYLELNRSYFSSLFKKRTGKSIRDYLIRYRIDKAKDMLLHTKYNISEIAFSVGYGDYFSFIKSFKKITGDTPKQYKKKHFVRMVRFLR